MIYTRQDEFKQLIIDMTYLIKNDTYNLTTTDIDSCINRINQLQDFINNIYKNRNINGE